MSPLNFLLILRAHYKVALLVAIVVTSATVIVNQLSPKRYTAVTSVLVDVRSPDPVANLIMPAGLGTQVEIIKSDRVAARVVRTLGLDASPAAREQWTNSTGGQGTQESWLATNLLRGLEIAPARDSNIVNITYTGADPVFAAAVANAFAQAYIDITIELKVDPARQYARWFGDQGKSLREALEKAQTKLSAFQQEKGIVANDERADIESTKLSDLASQLVKIQMENRDLRTKQKSGNAGDAIPDIVAHPTIAGLRNEIATQESRLRDTASNVGKNHPNYLRMQSEIVTLKQRLETETALIKSEISASHSIVTDRESQVTAAIEAQKRKVLQLKHERDQLAVLQRDVDSAKSAYETVSRRYTETTLASQATQANVTVLSPALVPLMYSSPKPLDKIAVLAILVGIALGIGAAFGLEMLDRRIRSINDLAEVLQLPILGEISRARKPNRLLSWRRSTALLAKQ